ncbi:PREDICTED: uncharacterized protein LOC108545853 [Eufriesea mexicana]|uniref:uncharacterized protein LOC108545853 n=1 Tax=Eufriesea mexicana TaxID=516756 RepID=UPI00083C8B47|nr:PREDICTED: uncharacterized protein LOC108545853 [Eufriesea mexicana]
MLDALWIRPKDVPSRITSKANIGVKKPAYPTTRANGGQCKSKEQRREMTVLFVARRRVENFTRPTMVDFTDSKSVSEAESCKLIIRDASRPTCAKTNDLRTRQRDTYNWPAYC